MADVVSRYKQNRLAQLRGFCYAARAKSISKAASKMLLSQPSVSLQIKALERELGVQLFERHGPRIALTYDGQRLLELAGPLVEAIDGLEASFCSVCESVEHGIVNVAAGGSTLQYLMPRFVAEFTRNHPRVDVRLHNLTGKAGLEQLRSGEVDFAVGPLLTALPDITFHPLVTYEPMLISRHDHPLAHRKRVTLKDVAKYPLILPPKNLSTHRIVESVLADHAARLRCQAGSGRLRCYQEIRAIGLRYFDCHESLLGRIRPPPCDSDGAIFSQPHIWRRIAERREVIAGGGGVHAHHHDRWKNESFPGIGRNTAGTATLNVHQHLPIASLRLAHDRPSAVVRPPPAAN